jgi:hypothetical protein
MLGRDTATRLASLLSNKSEHLSSLHQKFARGFRVDEKVIALSPLAFFLTNALSENND